MPREPRDAGFQRPGRGHRRHAEGTSLEKALQCVGLARLRGGWLAVRDGRPAVTGRDRSCSVSGRTKESGLDPAGDGVKSGFS